MFEDPFSIGYSKTQDARGGIEAKNVLYSPATLNTVSCTSVEEQIKFCISPPSKQLKSAVLSVKVASRRLSKMLVYSGKKIPQFFPPWQKPR